MSSFVERVDEVFDSRVHGMVFYTNVWQFGLIVFVLDGEDSNCVGICFNG